MRDVPVSYEDEGVGGEHESCEGLAISGFQTRTRWVKWVCFS